MVVSPHDETPRSGVELSSEEAGDLLGAYALDALDPDEAVAVERALARDDELAREAERLVRAAAWLGATEALTPPVGSRDHLLGRARARRTSRDTDDVATRSYQASTVRLAETMPALEASDYDEPTPNGLSA